MAHQRNIWTELVKRSANLKKNKTIIQQRIMDALSDHGGALEYEGLLYLVFPPGKYPNAYRHSSTGGPPGCAMALGRALRALESKKMIIDRLYETGRTIYIRKMG